MHILIDDAGLTARFILKGKLHMEGTGAITAPLTKLSEDKQGLAVAFPVCRSSPRSASGN